MLRPVGGWKSATRDPGSVLSQLLRLAMAPQLQFRPSTASPAVEKYQTLRMCPKKIGHFSDW